MTPRPTIFISAVSKELKSARQLVANALSPRYDALHQDILPTEQGDLREMLRRHIDKCEAVVQLVGHCFGTEAPQLDEYLGRISYTQYEAIYARQQHKKVWYFVIDKNFQVDSHDPESIQLQKLQSTYRRRLVGSVSLYHPVTSADALEASVLKIRDDLTPNTASTSGAKLQKKPRTDLISWWPKCKKWVKHLFFTIIICVIAEICIKLWFSSDQGKPNTVNVTVNVTNVAFGQVVLNGPSTQTPMYVRHRETAANATGMSYGPSAYNQAETPPKVGDSIHPKLAFDVFGLGQGATKWEPLGPETSLHSGEDFFIRAETFTPGFLYIFQVDSSGLLQWLFPSNSTYSNSFGANPLPASVSVTLPSDSGEAYALDDTVGEESIYAFYCANRWEKLEEKLKNYAGDPTDSARREIESLSTATPALVAQSKGIARKEKTAVVKEILQTSNQSNKQYPVDLQAQSMTANGSWLLQIRQFRHLARATTQTP